MRWLVLGSLLVAAAGGCGYREAGAEHHAVGGFLLADASKTRVVVEALRWTGPERPFSRVLDLLGGPIGGPAALAFYTHVHDLFGYRDAGALLSAPQPLVTVNGAPLRLDGLWQLWTDAGAGVAVDATRDVALQVTWGTMHASAKARIPAPISITAPGPGTVVQQSDQLRLVVSWSGANDADFLLVWSLRVAKPAPDNFTDGPAAWVVPAGRHEVDLPLATPGTYTYVVMACAGYRPTPEATTRLGPPAPLNVTGVDDGLFAAIRVAAVQVTVTPR